MGEEVGRPEPMRQKTFFPMLLSILVAVGLGQQSASSPGAASPAGDLNTVLARMNEASQHFKSGQADVEMNNYTAVVKETEVQSGKVFSRRRNGSQEVAIQIVKPHPKQVLIKGGKAAIYDPRIKQVTERSIGDQTDVESVMNMASAFGINGQDLLRDYEVKLVGGEKVDGIQTAKLELVPRKEGAKKLFSKIILWIDVQRDVALQQQRFGPDAGGPVTDLDYQLAHYTNIILNGKISDDVFTIKKGGGGD
jgi:outer membrane lipoprotein-sorting protein